MDDMGGGDVLEGSHPPTYFYKYILQFRQIHFRTITVFEIHFFNFDEYILQVRQKHFAIVSYGGTGGAGAVLEGSPPPPIYTCTRQPDTESHPPAPQRPIHSSPRGSISGPCAKPTAHIFLRTGTKIKKVKPPSAPPQRSGQCAERVSHRLGGPSVLAGGAG